MIARFEEETTSPAVLLRMVDGSPRFFNSKREGLAGAPPGLVALIFHECIMSRGHAPKGGSSLPRAPSFFCYS